MDTPSRKISAGCGAGRPLPSVLGKSAAAPGPSAAVANEGPVANEINNINTVAVKLSELWQSKDCSWFAQVEARLSQAASRCP